MSLDALSALPLAGKTIVVTRPQAQADFLAAGIRARGGTPWRFPLLEITALPEPRSLIEIAEALETFAFAIFISPNAVRHALAHLLARPWPAVTQALAVGSGTASALEKAGVAAHLPRQGFDSEALLALPCLASSAIAGKRVVIFRGNGGRELLKETLIARGAQVRDVTCYHRNPPTAGIDVFLQQLAEGRFAALTLSSSEALGHLAGLREETAFQAAIRSLPLFVSHPRIAGKARSAGFRRTILTAPGDEGVLAGLCAYNWRHE